MLDTVPPGPTGINWSDGGLGSSCEPSSSCGGWDNWYITATDGLIHRDVT
jgi:hypothetical protein